MEKITYASLGSLGEVFHRAFDEALKQVRDSSGAVVDSNVFTAAASH